MADSSQSRRSSRKPPVDRRARQATAGDANDSLRKVRGALGRPLAIERRDGQLQIVLVDRRRTAPADQAPLLADIRADLRIRLEDLADTPAARLMRHLGAVSSELERRGWAGVEAMPGSVLGRALVQAEMLASTEASDLLTILIDRLRLLKAAAEVREERQAHSLTLRDGSLLVSEATHEEFEASQLSWDASQLAPFADPADRAK
jgi:hypothetical protein